MPSTTVAVFSPRRGGRQTVLRAPPSSQLCSHRNARNPFPCNADRRSNLRLTPPKDQISMPVHPPLPPRRHNRRRAIFRDHGRSPHPIPRMQSFPVIYRRPPSPPPEINIPNGNNRLCTISASQALARPRNALGRRREAGAHIHNLHRTRRVRITVPPLVLAMKRRDKIPPPGTLNSYACPT